MRRTTSRCSPMTMALLSWRISAMIRRSWASSARVRRIRNQSRLHRTVSAFSNPERGGGFGFPFQIAGELAEAVEILGRAVDVAVVQLGGGAEGPEGVDEVRPRERHQVGSAGGGDGGGVVGVVDIADGQGCKPAR